MQQDQEEAGGSCDDELVTAQDEDEPKSGLGELELLFKQFLDKYNNEQQQQLDSDGEFLHITCHVEPAIKAKIEQGGFVDLDKLLPKPRTQNLFND